MRFGDEYGFYELNPFPGCSAIAVSNHSFIYPKFRGQGIGQRVHQERLEKAKILGYTYIICSVKKTNSRQIHILEKFDWKLLDGLFNQETENHLWLYGKSLIS